MPRWISCSAATINLLEENTIEESAMQTRKLRALR
jgi:hypothetical protein